MGRIKRYRTALSRHHRSRGFGIHSPFAFNFVRFVLREKSPYYCYEYLQDLRQAVVDTLREKRPHKRVAPLKDLKMLFRITNHFNPAAIMQIGTSYGLTTASMLNVSSTSRLWLYEPMMEKYPILGNVLQPYLESVHCYNSLEVAFNDYSQAIRKLSLFPFVLINSIPDLNNLNAIKTSLLKLTDDDCVIVMRELNRDDTMKSLWFQIKDSITNGQSFTNEKMGLIYVSKKYNLEHFFLWF